MVIRKNLLKKIRHFYQSFDLVKVITGIRRAGLPFQMRTKIRDLNLLNNIIQFLLDNIVSSLIFSKINRYDIKGKNIFSTLENIVANEHIQICYKIDSDKTLQRELNAFKGIPDKKLLITADTYNYSQNGVECVNAYGKWLHENA
jgi:predicted AAA+ superfamily ATPase